MGKVSLGKNNFGKKNLLGKVAVGTLFWEKCPPPQGQDEEPYLSDYYIQKYVSPQEI